MKLKRFERNPILEPREEYRWEARAVFNCGALLKDGLVHLIYRTVGYDEHYISRLGYAVSEDGINFKRHPSPIFEPEKKYEKWGCEDPRIVSLEGKIYMTYVALSRPAREGGGPPRTALASTKDFLKFKRHGVITPKYADERDVVLFPEKIDGKYVMLHRPYNWIEKNVKIQNGKLYIRYRNKFLPWPKDLEVPPYFPEKPSIWIAYSSNLRSWFRHRVLMEPLPFSQKIGAGPPPIKTKEGWILIYHEVLYEGNVRKYKVGAVLLDSKRPTHVKARTKNFILEPRMKYEIYGDASNVVFPTGVVRMDDELYVYYGAADKTCCLATCEIDELISYVYEGIKR